MKYLELFFFLLTLLLLLTGCNRNKIIHFYSLNKTQSITVINKGDYRYIINGKHNKIPKNDFVKLYVGDIDPIRDGLYICWQKKDYKWEVVNPKAKIVELNLDTSKFRVNTKLPLDSRGIPTSIKFDDNDSCAVFDFEVMRLIPNKGAIVEY